MHLSFASPAPWYLGTSQDRAHTRSLEADKSPANIRRLPRRAGHLQCWVTVKVLTPIPWDIPDEVPAQIPAQMITIKPQLQPRTCSPPTGRSACTNLPHYHDECPTIARVFVRGTNDRYIICFTMYLTWQPISYALQGHLANHDMFLHISYHSAIDSQVFGF